MTQRRMFHQRNEATAHHTGLTKPGGVPHMLGPFSDWTALSNYSERAMISHRRPITRQMSLAPRPLIFTACKSSYIIYSSISSSASIDDVAALARIKQDFVHLYTAQRS